MKTTMEKTLAILDLCEKYYNQKTFKHCRRVAQYIIDNPVVQSRDLSYKEQAFIIAMCHDLLEDTECSIEEIATASELSHTFLERTLIPLTKNPEEDYISYIKRLKLPQTSELSYLVKLADMKDHLSQTDTLSEKLKAKYWEALPILL